MSLHDAVRPGTHLSDHARDLVRMHHAVLAGAAPPLRPREVVARSWSRVLGLGLNPDGPNARDPLSFEEVGRRRAASPLNGVIDELKLVIGSVADSTHVLLVVTDAEGIVLWREGASSVRRQADVLGFSEGALWSESAVGTNAIGTALAEAAPVQLFSAEHFEALQHPWYCTASPMHDPRTGDLLGVIDVSGPALTLHPAIGALVETARRLAEAQLWRQHQEQLEQLRRHAAPLVATSRGALVVVDDDGWVAHSSGVSLGPRLAVPQPGRLVTVPGLGVCQSERLPHGWLLRADAPSGPVQLTLKLGSAPSLSVSSGDSQWQCTLTRRHAEILVLLDRAGAAGLSAQALSHLLFGDAEHVVTVRAEVSRLRRTLGTLVQTQPYRLAAGTQMSVQDGL